MKEKTFSFFFFVLLALFGFTTCKNFGFSQTAPTTTNETVALLDSLPSLSLSHSPHQPNPLSRYLVSLSNLPTLHAFQLKYLRNIQKVIEADEGPTVKGNLTRLSPTTWLWTTYDSNGKKKCGGDDYFVTLEVEGKREWGEDGEWLSGVRKLNHPVALVTDNMDGTYLFDFSDLSCSANEKTTTKEGEGEGGKKADLVEKFLGKFVEREGEKQEGGLEAEIVVLIQHSQAFGAKFYPKKNDCLLGCAINEVIHRERLSLSSISSSPSSPSSPSSFSSSNSESSFTHSSYIYQRDKIEKGRKNKKFIPFLTQFSHIFIAGDSIALQMHASLGQLINPHRHRDIDRGTLPLSPHIPTHLPSDDELAAHYYPKITLHTGDLRSQLFGYQNTNFHRFTKKTIVSARELIQKQGKRVVIENKQKRRSDWGEEGGWGEAGGFEGWEKGNETAEIGGGEGIAVVINTGLWNLLGDAKSEITDPLYSIHVTGLNQWILDLKNKLPKGVKLFYREMFAPQIHRVRCDLAKHPQCHGRVRYLAQSRGKYLSSLQHLIMKQHDVQMLGVYNTANEGSTQEGDGRHYINDLYDRLWKSWGTIDGKWVSVTPCYN